MRGTIEEIEGATDTIKQIKEHSCQLEQCEKSLSNFLHSYSYTYSHVGIETEFTSKGDLQENETR